MKLSRPELEAALQALLQTDEIEFSRRAELRAKPANACREHGFRAATRRGAQARATNARRAIRNLEQGSVH